MTPTQGWDKRVSVTSNRRRNNLSPDANRTIEKHLEEDAWYLNEAVTYRSPHGVVAAYPPRVKVFMTLT